MSSLYTFPIFQHNFAYVKNSNIIALTHDFVYIFNQYLNVYNINNIMLQQVDTSIEKGNDIKLLIKNNINIAYNNFIKYVKSNHNYNISINSIQIKKLFIKHILMFYRRQKYIKIIHYYKIENINYIQQKYLSYNKIYKINKNASIYKHMIKKTQYILYDRNSLKNILNINYIINKDINIKKILVKIKQKQYINKNIDISLEESLLNNIINIMIKNITMQKNNVSHINVICHAHNYCIKIVVHNKIMKHQWLKHLYHINKYIYKNKQIKKYLKQYLNMITHSNIKSYNCIRYIFKNIHISNTNKYNLKRIVNFTIVKSIKNYIMYKNYNEEINRSIIDLRWGKKDFSDMNVFNYDDKWLNRINNLYIFKIINNRELLKSNHNYNISINSIQINIGLNKIFMDNLYYDKKFIVMQKLTYNKKILKFKLRSIEKYAYDNIIGIMLNMNKLTRKNFYDWIINKNNIFMIKKISYKNKIIKIHNNKILHKNIYNYNIILTQKNMYLQQRYKSYIIKQLPIKYIKQKQIGYINESLNKQHCLQQYYMGNIFKIINNKYIIRSNDYKIKVRKYNKNLIFYNKRILRYNMYKWLDINKKIKINIFNINKQRYLQKAIWKQILKSNAKIKGLQLQYKWFILEPDENKDKIIIPNIDYLYEQYPVNNINTHPISSIPDINYNDVNFGVTEIDVSIKIMQQMLNFLFIMWNGKLYDLQNMLPDIAIEEVMKTFYNWLMINEVQQQMIEKNSRKDYLRIYRWFRWEAEKIWIQEKDDILNTGVKSIGMLVANIIEYMKIHHYNIVPITNKEKLFIFTDTLRAFTIPIVDYYRKELDKRKGKRKYYINTKNINNKIKQKFYKN